MKAILPTLFVTGALLGGAFILNQPTSAAVGSPDLDKPAKGVKNLAGSAGKGIPLKAAPGNELASFAMGCFWGSETIYRHVPGVVATSVGYTAGVTENPTYEEICGHGTKHAEAVLVEFDPKKVSYEKLLSVFWEGHDSTSGDRQGPDVGDQYRSGIYTFGTEQAKLAIASRDAFQGKLKKKITTEIREIPTFWLAETYHQQYHEKTNTAHCPFPKPPKKKA